MQLDVVGLGQGRGGVAGDAAEHEACGVPELVAETAIALDPGLVVAHVLARHRHGSAPCAQRVGTVLLDQLARVDAGAQRLGHPAAVRGLDDAVDRHVGERDLAHELEPGHDHPADPEKDDLAGGAVQVGRIEGPQVLGLLGPAERRERPQRGREPRVEHVGVLRQLRASAFRALVGRFDAGDDVAVFAVVDGHAMPEPQLPADVPVAESAHPVQVDALVALGVPAHLAGLAGGDRAVAQTVHAQPPLLADERLDDGVAAVAVADVVRIGLFLDEQALRLEVGHDELAGLDARQPVIAKAGNVHAAVGVHAVDDLQRVALADLVVHRVVPRRDLQRAGAEVHLHRFVADDRAAGGRPAAGSPSCR